MSRRFLSSLALVSCLSCLTGCGGSADTEVIPPPAVVSENVDADRAKEAGGAPPQNIDYTKQ